MAATLTTITLTLSLLCIAVWVVSVIKNPRIAKYTIPLFLYLVSMSTRYIVMAVIGYAGAITKYQPFFSTWTTVTNLYLLLVIFLVGVIVWKD